MRKWEKLFAEKIDSFHKSFQTGLSASCFSKTLSKEAASRRCSAKKGVLKNFGIFTGKHLCQSLLLNKVAGCSLQLY